MQFNPSTDKTWNQINMFKFKDKDTLQFVYYCPSLELSGYGKTEELSFEMVVSSIDDFFQYLSDMSMDDKQKELKKLGWGKTFFNKRFSKVFVDTDGVLQNFNALDNKVERVTLAA